MFPLRLEQFTPWTWINAQGVYLDRLCAYVKNTLFTLRVFHIYVLFRKITNAIGRENNSEVGSSALLTITRVDYGSREHELE